MKEAARRKKRGSAQKNDTSFLPISSAWLSEYKMNESTAEHQVDGNSVTPTDAYTHPWIPLEPLEVHPFSCFVKILPTFFL